MDKVTSPGPELRARMEKYHPELTALVDLLYADYGARLLSFTSSSANIDVVARRVTTGPERVSIRIWPETSVAEARAIEASRNSG